MDPEQWRACCDFMQMVTTVGSNGSLRQYQLLACACVRFPLIWARQTDRHRHGIERVEDHVDSRADGAVWSIIHDSGGFAGKIVGIEWGVYSDTRGDERLTEVWEELRGNLWHLAANALFSQDDFAWTLEELGATAWGTHLIQMGVDRFEEEIQIQLGWPVTGGAVHDLESEGEVPEALWAQHRWNYAWQEYVWQPELQEARNRAQQEFQQHSCNAARDLLTDLVIPLEIDPDWLTANNGAVGQLATEIYSQRSFRRLPELAAWLCRAGCQDDLILNHCRSRSQHFRGCWVLDRLLNHT